MRTNKLALAVSLALVVMTVGCVQRQVADSDSSGEREQALLDAKVKNAGSSDGRALAGKDEQGQRTKEDDALSAIGPGADKSELKKSADAPGEPMVVQEIAAPPATPAPISVQTESGAIALNAQPERRAAGFAVSATVPAAGMPALAPPAPPVSGAYWEPDNRENYADHTDNAVMRVAETPVSTFSIDVDGGAYSNVRRMINAGSLPPTDAVRAEEFINYFDYGYSAPSSRETPFSVTTELAAAPWNADHQLLLVGVKGYEVPQSEIPASNLVFLIDTSGSMESPDKIELLKQAFKLMTAKLRAQDRVSIVVYAGSAGLVLPPTAGDQHDTIVAALDQLSAGGSTNGGDGIQLAYLMAERAFIKNGVNRVILATDGDFNVGTVDTEALKTLVSDKRKSGVALTTLGFGQGNYNDEMAEQLADVGNGNHYYIDTVGEAQKVLVDEMSSTMLTIAKDVKIQIEFNPQVVAEYRLIGYENRMLRREDFNNDKIDAGEIGAGHDVTALYELTLVGGKGAQIDPLRYGANEPKAASGAELAFLKLRYKRPDQDRSILIDRAIRRADIAAHASERLRFAAAVAAFADSLRGGTHLGSFDLGRVAAMADDARGADPYGYRREFVDLVHRAQGMQTTPAGDNAVAITR